MSRRCSDKEETERGRSAAGPFGPTAHPKQKRKLQRGLWRPLGRKATLLLPPLDTGFYSFFFFFGEYRRRVDAVVIRKRPREIKESGSVREL